MPAFRFFALSLLLALTSGERLSADDKLFLLTAQNTVRGVVATGNTSQLNLNFTAPPAADLRVFAWMSRLARRAERIQLGLCFNESTKKTDKERDFIVAEQRTAVGGANASLRTLLDRLVDLGPDEASYWRQPLVQSHFVRLGCALRRCNNSTLLTCVYGSDLADAAPPKTPPYHTGAPCSKCPPGNHQCMNNRLCATDVQCQPSKSRCQCLVEELKCTADGGQMDSVHCRCTCGRKKSSGLYCSTPCTDKDCALPRSEKEKKEGLIPGACSVANLRARLRLMASCRHTCQFCRRDAFFKFATDRHPVPVEMYASLRYVEH